MLWGTFVASCVVVVDAIARPHVDVVAFVAGCAGAWLAALFLIAGADVLADPPEDELEERRRARVGHRRSP